MIAQNTKTPEAVRPLSIRLPDSVWRLAHEVARRQGVPLNTFITESLRHRLDQRDPALNEARK